MTGSDSSARASLTPAAYDALAASLGCAQKVSQGLRDGGSCYMTEYLPRDQSRREFNRQFRVTIYPLPEQEHAAIQQAEAILNHLSAEAQRVGSTIREHVVVPAALGGTAFLDYSMGGGHFVVAAVSSGGEQVAVLQLATGEGAIPSLADVVALRSIALPR